MRLLRAPASGLPCRRFPRASGRRRRAPRQASAASASGDESISVSWPRRKASSASHCHPWRVSPGWGTLGRTRWTRPSGWVTVPSFSAWDSAGRKTSAWPPEAFPNIPTSSTKSAAPRAVLPALWVGQLADRVDVPEDHASSSSASSASRICDRVHAHGGIREAGAGRRQAPDLAQAARVGGLGDLDQARALGRQVEALGARGQRGERPLALGAVTDPLAEDDDRLSRAGAHRRSARCPRRRRRPRSWRALRRGSRARSRLRRARSEASPPIRRRARSGAPRRRRRGCRDSASPCAGAGPGSASSGVGRCRRPGPSRPRRCRDIDAESSGRRAQARSRARGRGRRASRRAASRAPGARSAGAGSPPRSRPGCRSGRRSGGPRP